MEVGIASKSTSLTRAGKNLGFLEFFLGFLSFNVHNAEHRYMTHDK